ncbi:MAG: transposase [Candidatus Binatia bacterium]
MVSPSGLIWAQWGPAPITELLDEHESLVWIEKHFHPQGLRCPGCGATKEEAREFRTHKRGGVDYRCPNCQRTYNLYTGTLFAGSNLAPRRVVLLVRGICKGEPATVLAEELALSRQCVHRWRNRLQANAYGRLSAHALPDDETESDEMFQNEGEKR